MPLCSTHLRNVISSFNETLKGVRYETPFFLSYCSPFRFYPYRLRCLLMHELSINPLWLFSLILLVFIGKSLFKNGFGYKCQYCKAGKFKKISEELEGIVPFSVHMQHNFNGSAKTVVRMTVKY